MAGADLGRVSPRCSSGRGGAGNRAPQGPAPASLPQSIHKTELRSISRPTDCIQLRYLTDKFQRRKA